MKNELIALIFGIMMSMPYSEAQKQPIHPKILKTVDYCLDGFINEKDGVKMDNKFNEFINKYTNGTISETEYPLNTNGSMVKSFIPYPSSNKRLIHSNFTKLS